MLVVDPDLRGVEALRTSLPAVDVGRCIRSLGLHCARIVRGPTRVGRRERLHRNAEPAGSPANTRNLGRFDWSPRGESNS